MYNPVTMSSGLLNALAILGATTGCIALAWDVYKWKTAGPKLKVTVTPDMSMVVGTEIAPEKYFLVRVANAGRSKTTLTTLVWRTYRSAWDAFWRRSPQLFLVARPTPTPLPYPLDSGEAWVSTPLQDKEIQGFLEKGVVECLVYDVLSPKRPAVCRVRVFPSGRKA